MQATNQNTENMERLDLKGRIRDILHEKGMTQRDLAAKMGVTAATISVALNPRNSPSLDTLQRIEMALDVEVAELLAPIAKCPYCGRAIGIVKVQKG